MTHMTIYHHIRTMVASSAWIKSTNRDIIAIRKHISSNETLTCRSDTISIDESTKNRVIVSALQIIEARLRIVVVATVAEGVDVGDAVGSGNGIAIVVGDGEDLAPGVVGVACYHIAV